MGRKQEGVREEIECWYFTQDEGTAFSGGVQNSPRWKLGVF